MAHTPGTGKSFGTTITFGGDDIPTGWKQITITETGKPLAAQIDITHAGDASYSLIDDPLGGQGQAKCEISVEGLLSSTDHQDEGILASAIDSTGDVVVTIATGGDEFTATSARLASIDVGAAFAAAQPFSVKFSLASSAGVWATNT